MCRTWRQAAEIFGFKLNVSTPPGYELKGRSKNCQSFRDPMEAVRDAHLVTTDVWTSMGFEAERPKRKKALRRLASELRHDEGGAQGRALHALPAAHRGEEVTAQGHRRQAERGLGRGRDRLTHQKALMEFLLLGKVGDEG
jgi:ornithine carbamoyltransferase